MMISSRRTTLLALFTIFVLFESHAQLSFDIEGNYVFSIPYNTVRIPSEGGTKIDLANDLDTDETFTCRLRASYTIKNRHVLSALFAPLTIKSSGVLEEDGWRLSGRTIPEGDL
jgi:hypothetical protein